MTVPNGATARWLTDSGFRTRGGRLFTAHAVRDLLDCRFYLGIVPYQGEEFPGQHQPIISQELFLAAQTRKQLHPAKRTVFGASGLLQGMASCIQCGSGLQSDRHHRGAPMYRERHSLPCATNEKSIMASRVDWQIQRILSSVELLPDWQHRLAAMATRRPEGGPTQQELLQQRTRLARAYADGGLGDAEYEARKRELDRRIREAAQTELPDVKEAAELFGNVGKLWEEATAEERRKLVRCLIERVYVDLEHGRIGAIVPVPAFRKLLEGATVRAQQAEVVLLSPAEAQMRAGVEMVETGEEQPTATPPTLVRFCRPPQPAWNAVTVAWVA